MAQPGQPSARGAANSGAAGSPRTAAAAAARIAEFRRQVEAQATLISGVRVLPLIISLPSFDEELRQAFAAGERAYALELLRLGDGPGQLSAAELEAAERVAQALPVANQRQRQSLQPFARLLASGKLPARLADELARTAHGPQERLFWQRRRPRQTRLPLPCASSVEQARQRLRTALTQPEQLLADSRRRSLSEWEPLRITLPVSLPVLRQLAREHPLHGPRRAQQMALALNQSALAISLGLDALPGRQAALQAELELGTVLRQRPLAVVWSAEIPLSEAEQRKLPARGGGGALAQAAARVGLEEWPRLLDRQAHAAGVTLPFGENYPIGGGSYRLLEHDRLPAAALLGAGPACAHAAAAWQPDLDGEALLLACPDCLRGRLARVPAHLLPAGHPQRLDERSARWPEYLAGQRAARLLAGEEVAGLDSSRALRERDGGSADLEAVRATVLAEAAALARPRSQPRRGSIRRLLGE